MNKKIFVVIFEASAGILGNLIAGWIQNDIIKNEFPLIRVLGIITGIVIALFIIAWLENLDSSFLQKSGISSHTSVLDVILQTKTNPNARERALDGLLQNVKNTWIDNYLMKSINSENLIKLHLSYWSEAVSRTDDVSVLQNNQKDVVLSNPKSILKLFEEYSSNILILGEAGSGKTVFLLQLIDVLRKAALKDTRKPVPIYLNISTWSRQKLLLDNWVAEEMLKQYQISRYLTKKWLIHSNLILILDGLDEVKQENMNDCISAINKFKAEYPIDVVVSCRLGDYKKAEERLNLTAAFSIQKLDNEQIEKFLVKANVNQTAVQNILNVDNETKDFFASPLILNILVSTYNGSHLTLDETDTDKDLQLKFLSNYIDHNFTRRSNTISNLFGKRQCLLWLSNIAKVLIRNNNTMFFTDQMQPNWVNSNLLYMLLVGLLSGSIIGCIEGISLGTSVALGSGVLWWGALLGLVGGVSAIISNSISGAISGLVGGGINNRWFRFIVVVSTFLITDSFVGSRVGTFISSIIIPAKYEMTFSLSGGLMGGLLLGLVTWKRDIDIIERLTLSIPSPKKLFSGLAKGVLIGFVAGLISGIYNILFYISIGNTESNLLGGAILTTIIYSMFCGLVGLIFALVQPVQYQEKIKPNQGIRNSLINAGKLAILGGVVGGLLGWWQDVLLLGDVGWFLSAGIELGTLGAFFYFGGNSFFAHYSLRILSSIKKIFPLNLLRFLNGMTDLMILRNVGAGYIFVHPVLLQYFGSLNEDF